MKNHFHIIFLLVLFSSCNTDTKTESTVKVEANATEKAEVLINDLTKAKIVESFKTLPESKKSFLDFALGSSLSDCKILSSHYVDNGIFFEQGGNFFYQLLDLDLEPINFIVNFNSLDNYSLTSIELEIVDKDTVSGQFDLRNSIAYVPTINKVVSLYSKKYGTPFKIRAFMTDAFAKIYGKKMLLNEEIISPTAVSSIILPSSPIQGRTKIDIRPNYNYYKWTSSDKIIYLKGMHDINAQRIQVKKEFLNRYKSNSNNNDPNWYTNIDVVVGYKRVVITYTNEKFDKIKNQRLNQIDQNKTRNLEQESQTKKNKIDSVLKTI